MQFITSMRTDIDVQEMFDQLTNREQAQFIEDNLSYADDSVVRDYVCCVFRLEDIAEQFDGEEVCEFIKNNLSMIE